MSDDTTKKLTDIQNLFDATRGGEFSTKGLEKHQVDNIKPSDMSSTQTMGQLLGILREQVVNKPEESQKKDDGVAKSANFDLAMAYGAEALEMQKCLMKQFENSKAESDVARPLDEKLSDDSSPHSKNSRDSPTKRQDKLNLEVCEEVVESVDSAQISPNVSNDGIHNTATDPIAFEDNSKSYDSWGSCFTSLSERPNSNKLQQVLNEDLGVGTYANFDLEAAYDLETLEMQKLIMQHFENSKARGDVAIPLDEKLSVDSPTKHQDKLNLGVCEEMMESVNSAQISLNVSDDGIHNSATDPIAFEDNPKSYDSSHKSLTSLPERPKIDATNASKVDLPKNRPAEGSQPTNVQEPMGLWSAVVSGGGEVTVEMIFERMLQAEEDRKRYSTFDRTDYSICGEILYCRICEKNVYSINPDHMKSFEHEQRFDIALTSSTKRDELRLTGGWQITANGLMRCDLCQKDYNIQTKHCSSEAHVLSKKYKTCPRIQALKLRAEELWKKLPSNIFDQLLRLRTVNDKGLPAEATFCVGCNKQFETQADRERHERECQFHQSIVESTKKYSKPFSYLFGILPQARIEGGQPYSYLFGILPQAKIELGQLFRYCLLCKTGMTNAIEQDNHVHGANSQHSTRMRVFWKKVIPGLLESGLIDAFPPPVKDTALYSPNVPLLKQLYYFENLLHVIVINTDGYSMCSLCDEYVCDRSMTSHCDRVKHKYMNIRFLESLRNPNRRGWGFVQKENVLYCVLCHVGFSNKFEMEMHLNSVQPHLNRAEQFNKCFDRFIKSAVHSSNGT